MVKQAPCARSPYSFTVLRRAALCCLVLSLPLSAVWSAEIQIRQDYSWPDEAGIRLRLQDGGLLVFSRWDHRATPGGGAAGSPVLGVSLPWLRCGPLLARGMLRQVSDPLGYSAWSSVFQERTTLVLDGALSSASPGVLFMPLPELCGVFCLPVRSGGNEYGAFGRLPLGIGAVAEAAILVSRPLPQLPSDDWFLAHSLFPGGDITDLCARLVLGSPSFWFSFTSGISSAKWAAPGAFSNLLFSGGVPWLQAAFLLAGVTPGYRAPDGTCSSGASQLSAMVRLGNDRRTGFLEAGWSFVAARPSFSPRAEIPTRMVVRAELSRDFERPSGPPLSLVLDGEKDISRECDGIRIESARCGSTVCASFPGMDVAAGVSLSDLDGVRLLGALTMKPSHRLRILVEAKGNGLAGASPAGSMTVKVSFERGGQRATVQTGFVDCPLTSRNSRIAEYFRLSLSCSLLCEP